MAYYPPKPDQQPTRHPRSSRYNSQPQAQQQPQQPYQQPYGNQYPQQQYGGQYPQYPQQYPQAQEQWQPQPQGTQAYPQENMNDPYHQQTGWAFQQAQPTGPVEANPAARNYGKDESNGFFAKIKRKWRSWGKLKKAAAIFAAFLFLGAIAGGTSGGTPQSTQFPFYEVSPKVTNDYIRNGVQGKVYRVRVDPDATDEQLRQVFRKVTENDGTKLHCVFFYGHDYYWNLRGVYDVARLDDEGVWITITRADAESVARTINYYETREVAPYRLIYPKQSRTLEDGTVEDTYYIQIQSLLEKIDADTVYDDIHVRNGGEKIKVLMYLDPNNAQYGESAADICATYEDFVGITITYKE